jgi:plastocyanin
MTRPRAVALAAAVAAVAAAAAGPAASGMDGMGGAGAGMDGAAATTEAKVSILYAAFGPARLDVVAGDTVRWVNDSARPHDVVAGDQSFDSGRLTTGLDFAHRFEQAGTFTYYCSVHPFMTGEVDVHPLVIDAPAVRGATGKPFVLSGRAASGITGSVAIEGDDGSGFRRAGTAAVAPDGTFRTTVVPRTTTSYRVVAGDQQSAPVQLLVLDHTVSVTTRHHGRSTTVSVRVSPAAMGAPVVLQLRLRERFGWWPVRQARLGHDSTARFVVARGSRAPARVLLTLRDGATELARSRTVQVGPGV